MVGTADLSIVAVVKFNDGEALVLNRPLRLRYRREGNDFIGADGPFADALKYERAFGRFKAFAGREMRLDMEDGTTEVIKDHWWSVGLSNHSQIAVGDVASLKRCYVFGGALVDSARLQELRAGYTGCVYPYWDYERVINFDDMRNDLLRRISYEQKRSKALIREVKRKHKQLEARHD